MNKYPFSETLDDVFASLWKRKGVTLVIVIVIGLFVASLYLNTQFSVSTIENARAQMAPALSHRVILTIGVEARTKGFTPQLFDEMKSLLGVESATEYYEVTVNIRNKGSLGRQTVMESVAMDDLVFSPDMILVGKGIRHEDEIVLGKTLADILGIEKPGQQITVLLERTTNEAVEPLEFKLNVCGIVKGDDRCYALTSFVKSLDLWASHTTTAFAEEKQSIVADYPYAIGFVEETYYPEAEERIKALGLTSKCVGQFYLPQEPKSFWGQIETPSALPAEKVFPFYMWRHDANKIQIVLRQDDPRWKLDREKNSEQLFGPLDTNHQIEYVQLESAPEIQKKLPTPEYHLFIQGKEEWNYFQKYYSSVTPLLEEGFRFIRVLEIRTPEPTITQDIVTVLNMTKPIFRYVRGGTTLEASLFGKPITLDSASPRDTRGQIFQNQWFTGDMAHEIIIGSKELKLLGEHAKDGRDQNVSLTVSRKNKLDEDETIELPMRIIESAPNSMIPHGLAANLVLWQKDKVIFTNGQFVKRYEFETSNGTRRAKLFLRSPEDVEAVSKKYAPEGYLVDNKLKLIENLRNLERNMTVFVLMFCGTSFLLCLITLWGYSYMNHSMKRDEFGAMLLMGIPRGSLVQAVLIEGLVYSVAAVLLAVFLVVLLAAPYQMVLEDVFHMPKGSIEIGLHSTGGVVSLLIGIFMSICLGMVAQIPAIGISWFDKRPQKI